MSLRDIDYWEGRAIDLEYELDATNKKILEYYVWLQQMSISMSNMLLSDKKKGFKEAMNEFETHFKL